MSMITVDGVAIKDPSSFSYGLQDVSSSEAGRTQDSLMHKLRVAQKVKIALSWSMLTPAETSAIMQAFNPEYVTVTYPDALRGTDRTAVFYTGDKTAPMKSWFVNNQYYETLSFDIIER